MGNGIVDPLSVVSMIAADGARRRCRRRCRASRLRGCVPQSGAPCSRLRAVQDEQRPAEPGVVEVRREDAPAGIQVRLERRRVGVVRLAALARQQRDVVGHEVRGRCPRVPCRSPARPGIGVLSGMPTGHRRSEARRCRRVCRPRRRGRVPPVAAARHVLAGGQARCAACRHSSVSAPPVETAMSGMLSSRVRRHRARQRERLVGLRVGLARGHVDVQRAPPLADLEDERNVAADGYVGQREAAVDGRRGAADARRS